MAVFSKLLKRLTTKMWAIDVDFGFGELCLPLVGTLLLCLGSYILTKVLKNTEVSVPVRDLSKSHNWKAITLTSKTWYCSVCEMFLLNGIGVYCDCCGVCADPECVKKANRKLPCKIPVSNKEFLVHHWVQGNLPFGVKCTICREECSVEHGLVDYCCCWCQRSIHSKCLVNLDMLCDFGEFREMIVPPHCIKVARPRSGFHRNMLITNVKSPEWKNWSPLIVIANRKSGNGDGEVILSAFRKWLNPVQVIDLADRKPLAALQWCLLLAPKRVRILVAGGDGTVAWVLTTAHNLNLDPEPSIAILPLGTGNDLSRVLGWGKEHSSDLDVHDFLQKIRSATTANLDRWKINISSSRHMGLSVPNRNVYMYNYMSVGVDAQVALDFHRTRESAIYLFSNRVFNKILYLCFGTQQVVSANCKNLEQKLELWLDGRRVDLPELESVVVLNIPSWGAGVNLWEMTEEPASQSYHDGILEVLGLYSSFHIAQLQVGLSSPHVLGQAKTVEIVLKHKAPIQVDGEPWEQHPSKITINLANRTSVLVNRNP